MKSKITRNEKKKAYGLILLSYIIWLLDIFMAYIIGDLLWITLLSVIILYFKMRNEINLLEMI